MLTLCNAPTPIPSAIASVPVGFDEWFVHATQRDVDKRFRSARDMANELIQLANAPMTGKGFAGATHGYGRLGPVTTPPAGTPAGQQGRMSMTTGQSASVSRSSSHGSARSNNGVWIFATAAMVLVTAGVGAYAWKTSKLTDVSAPASSPDTSAEQPLEEEVEGESEAPAKKDATPSKDGVETRPSEQETEPAAPLPQERPPAPSKEQRTEKKHGAEKKPSTAPEEAKPVEKPATKDVPVVDKQALPPEEWNF